MMVDGWRSIGLIGVFNMTLPPFVSLTIARKISKVNSRLFQTNEIYGLPKPL
jgi:hypothetical protein